ncbi:hypothetical protein HUZ36_07035 [Pseudoalteromonas sp. McH1-7]|uniref:DUF5602 domain-containing protein n=1 Tax=Pseudoalteromonas peptidolytica F12-50-A1 TaxID=1315280 RepID=A0A8I0T4L8_9GAMM|nr:MULTISPECIES: hypothetical protein [Pseudoalteromonas]MBE0347115.1 hypothetical protein [Pseudoalteromonas peptidolytica F12-50-A1]MDW7549259.1 hypothetical protein [Pseudoalteromonas peptidolytica]NLR15963.1 hypothetical protein [Pseudoalteromonas peptidolytica]NUZ10528.1 hypothetical protein [Pseudoalteromonas sp. McH1-7]RRS08748.1 hypothetical protein EAG18_10290 [Pseudoalteromonas sp. J010]
MNLKSLALIGLISTSASAATQLVENKYPVTNPEVFGKQVFDDGMHTLRVYGEVMHLGGGTVNTWISLAAGGYYKIGMTFSPEILDINNLPTEATHHDAYLDFPRLAGSPFKHSYFSWNPAGHAPTNIYDIAHFDIHLSFFEKEELAAIQFADPEGQILPPAEYMPPTSIAQTFPDGSYINVPSQGVHWYYEDTPEYNGGVFTETMLWGSYNGKLSFVEPMITFDTIMTETFFEKEIDMPLCVEATGFYPKVYGWQHKQNAEGQTYIDVYMKDFVFMRANAPGCR